MGATAYAVDLPPAPILDDEDETLGSGWYLRGDTGGVDASISRRSRDTNLSSFVNGKLDQAFMVGIGLGYQFSPWFRADVTVDHRFAASLRGTDLGTGGAYALDRANVDATAVFLNGYVDLPLWIGITPYVGAGIGLSQLRVESHELVGISGAMRLPSQTDTLLAWALMGGVAFDITGNLKVDLGYRYSRLDGGGFDRNAAFRPRQVNAHEFRIGARYLFE
jgi:opacity protein-like surface antigen